MSSLNLATNPARYAGRRDYHVSDRRLVARESVGIRLGRGLRESWSC